MTKTPKIELQDAMMDNFMPYSAYLILHRALPMIDGLKPSQRRVLYTMYKKGITPNKPYVKSHSIGGDVMKIHPHGSTYETLVRMSEGHEAFSVPLIDSKGNFGKLYSRDGREAADRYTEARLSKIAMELFKGIELDAVPMKETYDGQGLEPEVLPVPFPVILTNGISGMAVGMATDIPPFNYHEVINYTIQRAQGGEPVITDYIKAPDFPTENSIVYDKQEMENILKSGRGSITIRANYEFEENSIIFHGVPYTTRYEAVMEQIAKAVEEGKLKEVTDIHDLYGMNSTGIQVVARKNTDLSLLVEKLFKLTKLQDTFSLNMNIVLDNKPQVLGVDGIVNAWLDFRKTTIKNMTEHQLKNTQLSLERLRGMEKILSHLDQVIELIRSTKGNKVVSELVNKFKLTSEQAEYISNLQLRQLAQDSIENRLKEIQGLLKRIESLNVLLSDEETLMKYIISELQNLNKTYSYPRRTGFIQKEEVERASSKLVETVVEDVDYNLKAFVTKDLYFKKIPLTSMRGNFTNRLKEDDEFVYEEELTNLGEIIAFTNKHNIYKKRFSDIEDTRPSELGEYLPSVFDLEKGEEILFAIPLGKDFDKNIILGFTDGNVAKIETKAYYTKQNRAVLRNAYAKNKELLFVVLDNGVENLLGETQEGLKVVRDLSTFEPKSSRSVGGSKFMSLNKDDTVVEYRIPTEEEIEKYSIKSAGKGRK